MCAYLVIQSYFTHCNPMDFSPLGSPFHGIFQARIVERFAFFSLRNLLDPGIELKSVVSPPMAGEFFSTEPPGKPTYLQ